MALTATINESTSVSVSQLYAELLEHSRIAFGLNSLVKGRQIYWMILNHHKTSESMEVVIGVDHLTMLGWKGDKQMYNFKSLWESITRRMTDQLT